MRSIFFMPSDDMAGGAKRRVPIPIKKGGKPMDPDFLLVQKMRMGDGRQWMLL